MAASLVADARFRMLGVPSRVSIREFAESRGLRFAAGKGFYELTKAELIQAYKEVVAVRRSDGSKVSGAAVRTLLGIPASAAKFRLDAGKLSDFKIFVQSTSYNRVLMPGTDFLYEVDASAAVESATATAAASAERPPAPPSGAGMPLEIAFSFDTTGSMSSILPHVRERLQELIQRLQRDIPGLRVAVFAHGDYCDAPSSYVTKHVDFTTDVDGLCEFVRGVSPTGGGDTPECYELVLKEAREKLSWTPGTQRALVMIGDAPPHEFANYSRDSVLKKYAPISWRDEVDKIARELGCRIYSVQCGRSFQGATTAFWKHMAHHTHGYHLSMDNFSNVFDFIMAICYREQGEEQLQAYRKEVEERSKASGGINADLHSLFESLASGSGAGSSAPLGGFSSARKRKSSSAPASAKKGAAKRAKMAGESKSAAAKSGAKRGGGGAAAAKGRTSVAKKGGAAKTKKMKKSVGKTPAAAAAAAAEKKKEATAKKKASASAKKGAAAGAAAPAAAATTKKKKMAEAKKKVVAVGKAKKAAVAVASSKTPSKAPKAKSTKTAAAPAAATAKRKSSSAAAAAADSKKTKKAKK